MAASTLAVCSGSASADPLRQGAAPGGRWRIISSEGAKARVIARAVSLGEWALESSA